MITECQALREFVQKFHEIKVIPKFGSSDCKLKCGGHLLSVSSNQDILAEYSQYFSHSNWNEFKFESEY